MIFSPPGLGDGLGIAQADGQITQLTDQLSYEINGRLIDQQVRLQQFHIDISEFYAVYKVWERHLAGRPLPFSAVEVPAPLPVPGASVLIEAWVYAP